MGEGTKLSIDEKINNLTTQFDSIEEIVKYNRQMNTAVKPEEWTGMSGKLGTTINAINAGFAGLSSYSSYENMKLSKDKFRLEEKSGRANYGNSAASVNVISANKATLAASMTGKYTPEQLTAYRNQMLEIGFVPSTLEKAAGFDYTAAAKLRPGGSDGLSTRGVPKQQKTLEYGPLISKTKNVAQPTSQIVGGPQGLAAKPAGI